VVGIALGFVVNLTGLPVPGIVNDALDLLIRAALPAALFGLGGVLVRYRLEGDLRVIGLICAVSLVLHPAIVWTLGQVTGLSTQAFRSAVLTAAMPPGVNSLHLRRHVRRRDARRGLGRADRHRAFGRHRLVLAPGPALNRHGPVTGPSRATE
jgi:predicted permease